MNETERLAEVAALHHERKRKAEEFYFNWLCIVRTKTIGATQVYTPFCPPTSTHPPPVRASHPIPHPQKSRPFLSGYQFIVLPHARQFRPRRQFAAAVPRCAGLLRQIAQGLNVCQQRGVLFWRERGFVAEGYFIIMPFTHPEHGRNA